MPTPDGVLIWSMAPRLIRHLRRKLQRHNNVQPELTLGTVENARRADDRTPRAGGRSVDNHIDALEASEGHLYDPSAIGVVAQVGLHDVNRALITLQRGTH